MTRLMDLDRNVARFREPACTLNVSHTNPFHRHLHADVLEAVDTIRARNDLPHGDVMVA